jgi:hypothetical protein
MQRDVSRGCPQVSCCVPGFWNIQYNSLLNLNFARRTKTVAYADDLTVAIRGKTVSEVENFKNLEVSKITLWAKNNKITFNDGKCKIRLISRTKRKKKRKRN